LLYVNKRLKILKLAKNIIAIEGLTSTTFNKISLKYDLNIIAGHIDALYANYDNRNIPLMEAVRVVSVAQDGEPQKADLILIRAQKKYSP